MIEAEPLLCVQLKLINVIAIVVALLIGWFIIYSTLPSKSHPLQQR